MRKKTILKLLKDKKNGCKSKELRKERWTRTYICPGEVIAIKAQGL